MRTPKIRQASAIASPGAPLTSCSVKVGGSEDSRNDESGVVDGDNKVLGSQGKTYVVLGR